MSQTGWMNVVQKLRESGRGAIAVFYGMSTYEWVLSMRRDRSELERLFFLITFGDLIGLPLLPPFYTLRLLPFIYPRIRRWKRELLKERDLTDLGEYISGIG